MSATTKRPHVSLSDDAASPDEKASFRELRALIREEGEKNRKLIEEAVEKMKSELTSEMKTLQTSFEEKLKGFCVRINEVEKHLEEKGQEHVKLREDLKHAQDQVASMRSAMEENEIRNRLNCLVFSGSPVRRPPGRLPAGSAAGAAPGSPEGEQTPREDVQDIVIRAVKDNLGITLPREEIDRAHRMSEGRKIIVRFLRSGESSIRDRIYQQRLQQTGRSDGRLFVNESLTAARQKIFNSLLELKKAGKVYTVFTRWGNVFAKEVQYGVSVRVNNDASFSSFARGLKN